MSNQDEELNPLTIEAYDKWLYANYPIYNGDMLLNLYENMSVFDAYLRDNDLPLDSEMPEL